MLSSGEWVLAVDLGTTRTRAAYTAPGSREPIDVQIPPDFTSWLPSSVARDPDAGGWLVGKDAERLRTGWTGAFFQNAKRLLGQPEPHYIDGHPFSILEIVAQPLIHAATIARADAGRVFDRLALAMPVEFGEYRKDLLFQAGEMAGFPRSRISVTTEAEAAARAALGPAPEDGTWVLFDMGGGTLDVALLRTRAGGLHLLDTFGTDEVSGYVLDSAIMERLRTAYPPIKAAMPDTASGGVGPAPAAPENETAQDAGQWRETLLRETAELAKTGVTARGPGRATLPEPRVRVALSPDDLRVLATPILARAVEKCQELLDANKLQWDDLTAIICSGGSTRGPVIREFLAAKTEVRDATGVPELAVVHGLLIPQERARPAHPKTIRPANVGGVHQLRSLAHPALVTALAFSPSGQYLATASGSLVQVWNPIDGTKVWTFDDHTNTVTGLTFAPDGRLASGSTDQTIRLRVPGHDDSGKVHQAGITVRSVAFSPDGSLLAWSGGDNQVHLWEPDTGTDVAQPLAGPTEAVIAATFAPDGSALASATGTTAWVWDLEDGSVHAVLKADSGRVNALAFSPDSSSLVTASHDRTVRIWDPRRGLCKQVLSGHPDWVLSVAFSPTGELIASGDDDGYARLWNPETGDELSVLGGHSGRVQSIALSPDGTLLACGDNSQVWIWGLG